MHTQSSNTSAIIKRNSMLLTFAVTVFALLSLAAAVPTPRDSVKIAAGPGYTSQGGAFGLYWVLDCPPRTSKVSAKECWRRFATGCDDWGRLTNDYYGNGNICNPTVCHCAEGMMSYANPAPPGSGPVAGPLGSWKLESLGASAAKLSTSSSAMTSSDVPSMFSTHSSSVSTTRPSTDSTHVSSALTTYPASSVNFEIVSLMIPSGVTSHTPSETSTAAPRYTA